MSKSIRPLSLSEVALSGARRLFTNKGMSDPKAVFLGTDGKGIVYQRLTDKTVSVRITEKTNGKYEVRIGDNKTTVSADGEWA